ncbi:MAG: bifunctional homocysteine S-methyltransferase/methylenetetrahydrofolate reductase [bacterium]|nr:bifunctional homocysteine S-methyltransferase/methylenetetrahydrofolate reductase [bacterium]
MNRILEKLKNEVIVADGGMGTVLYDQGIPFQRCYDSLNLSDPVRIERIHRSYVAAGAELIETNTFGANRIRLSSFGLTDKVEIINRRGVEIARWAIGPNGLVAGSMSTIGKPLRPIGKIDVEEAEQVFYEQAISLVNGGVDLLLLETFSDLSEAVIAVRAAKRAAQNRDVPVWLQMTFTDEGKTLHGDKPEEIVRVLQAEGVDGLGANCSVGPQILLEVMERISRVSSVPLSCMPNAGLPKLVNGRYVYLTTPTYLAEFAEQFRQIGVSLIGGCCGTTPEHIRSISEKVKGKPIEKKQSSFFVSSWFQEPELPIQTTSETLSDFLTKVKSKFYVSVEIDPPRGINTEKLIQGAKICKSGGVDCINVADSPLARARMSPLALSTILAHEVGLDVILHLSCRDRNSLAIQAELMGAHALDIRNILAVTGDPPTLGDYPSAKGVFELDSIRLTQLITLLNQGFDLSGRKLDTPCQFTVGVAVNPTAEDLDSEIEKLNKKIDAGAKFIMTQPLFEIQSFETFLLKWKKNDVPILLGILPLRNAKHAEYIHYEVPGMVVPEKIRQRMYIAGENGIQEGIRISQELLKEFRNVVNGIYLMPPFHRFEIAVQVLQVL